MSRSDDILNSSTFGEIEQRHPFSSAVLISSGLVLFSNNLNLVVSVHQAFWPTAWLQSESFTFVRLDFHKKQLYPQMYQLLNISNLSESEVPFPSHFLATLYPMISCMLFCVPLHCPVKEFSSAFFFFFSEEGLSIRHLCHWVGVILPRYSDNMPLSQQICQWVRNGQPMPSLPTNRIHVTDLRIQTKEHKIIVRWL